MKCSYNFDKAVKRELPCVYAEVENLKPVNCFLIFYSVSDSVIHLDNLDQRKYSGVVIVFEPPRETEFGSKNRE